MTEKMAVLDDIMSAAATAAENNCDYQNIEDVFFDVSKILRHEMHSGILTGTVCDIRDAISLFGIRKKYSKYCNVLDINSIGEYLSYLKLISFDRRIPYEGSTEQANTSCFTCLYAVLNKKSDMMSIS